MPADKHLAVTEDTKQRIETLKHKLALADGTNFTQNDAVVWLLENAPDPDDMDQPFEETR